MSNEIKGVRGAPTSRAGLSAVTGPPAARASQGGGRASASDDRVSLTGLGAQLQAITRSLERVPVVDMARVTSVREAVVNGSYEVDAMVIADKLIRFELMLPEPSYADTRPA
ncbi:MAG: flagellar biosynthesis anti-sigma factor FlgM [Gammaproteobacteria bacterium]|jgi:negative regulator of flagellin synthesis FlgM|nr:flagellar biosynthesis anti-sigma factor FlgM [Gammaproteobacteria bacterium]